MTLCVPGIILQRVDNQRDAQFLVNNFYFTVFSCSTCFERITRSSKGALFSILYHAVGTIVQVGLATVHLVG